MNILFLATLPPESSTLIGRTLPLAHALSRRGHIVHIATLGTILGSVNRGGAHLHVVGPSLRGTSPARPPTREIIQRVRAGIRALHEAEETLPADIVVLVKPHPQNVLATRRSRKPIILDSDDDERWASRLTRLERWFMDRVDHRAARRAVLVTACSPALADRYGRDRDVRAVELLPTGMDPHEESGPPLRATLGLPPDARVVLYIGSLALRSGHRVDTLLAAWDTLAARSTDLHLVIAGDGIDETSLRAQAEKTTHVKRIHFLGRFNWTMAEGLSRQASLLVDPVDDSPASRAKSSFRTLLALRTGTPVIAGDVGIRRTLLPLSVRSWALYPTGDQKQFIAALERGLAPDARQRFATATKGLWELWTWERLGRQFQTALERASA